MARDPRLSKYEIAARMMFPTRFVDPSPAGIRDSWNRLDVNERGRVVTFVQELLAAPFGTHHQGPIHRTGSMELPL